MANFSYSPLFVYIKPEGLFTGTLNAAAMPDTSYTGAELTAVNAPANNYTGWIEVAGDNVEFERDSFTLNNQGEYVEVLSGNKFGVIDSRLVTQRIDASWTLRDETLDLLTHLYHGQTVTTVAAAANVDGGNSMDLLIPRSKNEYHIQCIIRMTSPVNAALFKQYWLPLAVFQQESSGTLSLGTPLGRQVKVMALAHDTLGYGITKVATTAASS